MIDHPESELLVQAFQSGAKGIFTCYESQFDALCECISCVHSGQVWANAQQMNCLIDAVAKVPTVRLVIPGLTPFLTLKNGARMSNLLDVLFG